MGIALCLSRHLRPRVEKLFSINFPQISVTQNVFNLRRFALCSKYYCERRDTRLPLDPVQQSALCSAPCQLSPMNTRFSHLDVHVIDSTFSFMIPHHWLPFTFSPCRLFASSLNRDFLPISSAARLPIIVWLSETETKKTKKEWQRNHFSFGLLVWGVPEWSGVQGWIWYRHGIYG